VRRAILSAFWIGFLPGLSGTYASAVTAAACLLAAHAGAPLWVAGSAALVLGAVATLTLAAPREGDAPGARAEPAGAKHGDPRWVVTDEVAGQGLAVLGAVGARSALVAVLVSFAVFRALDIGKPGVVGRLERLPGAVGVFADDLAAGVGGALAAAAAVAFAGA
jgi:phosphatidylglycerophosphatase A